MFTRNVSSNLLDESQSGRRDTKSSALNYISAYGSDDDQEEDKSDDLQIIQSSQQKVNKFPQNTL